MHTLVLNADASPVCLLPISTLRWEDSIRAFYSNSVSVIAQYSDWVVHSPSRDINVPSVVMARQYLHYNRTVQYSKRYVLLRDRYTCQYCGKILPESQLTLDHVLPVRHGGKTRWDNITTSCAPCNTHKGSNRKIVPKVRARQPSYYELLNIRKEYPVVVPCESWVDYLDWPKENIRIAKKILHK